MLRLACVLLGLVFIGGGSRGTDWREAVEGLIAWRIPGEGDVAGGEDEQAADVQLEAGNDNPAADEPVAVTAIFAKDVDSGEIREIGSIPSYPIINSPEISPDGKWVAVDGWKADENLRDARVLFINVENGSVVNLVKGCMPSWSADGEWIAFCKYGAERGVYIRSVEGDTERLIDRDGWGIQWAPNGLKAAYTRGGTFVIYDFIGDTRTEIKTDEEWPYSYIYWNCKWSADSKQICFMGGRGDGGKEFAILDMTGEKPRLRVRCDAEGFNPDIAWHPNGTRIAIPKGSGPDEPGGIYVFDPTRFEPPTRMEGQPDGRANGGGMCWSRDGETLIFLSRG